MKNFTLFIAIVVFGSLYSCQKETVSETSSPESLTKASALSSLMSRVTQSPTSKDNILDGTSCFSVVLPVSISVDSNNVTVLDSNYYQTVRDIINEYSNDDDIVHFNFPIRLRYPNFQEVQVANQQEYNAILASCGPDSGFHEIECIDFNFPLVVNTYNSETQTPNTITISSNSQFYVFLSGLTANLVYNISYPLSMRKSNGDNIVFNANSELQAGIENVIDDCNDDAPDDSLLSEEIVDGTWRVSSFIDGSEDETYEYNGYVFTFNLNGTSLAVRNSITTNGNWASYVDDGYSKLTLSYYGDALEECERDWRVIEFSSTFIKLRHISESNGKTHYLTFMKN
jgi:hypothetical protein